jgi:hypothetical protein
MAKVSKAEKVKALRDKLKTQDLGGGGAGFYSPKVGKNIIRILPEVGDMEFFFQPVGRHYFPDGRKVYCPSFTTEKDRECPVCEIVRELHSIGDKQSKKLASSLNVGRSWWMNVIDRNNESAGPLMYTPGVMVFNSIISLINDPDYGDITDIDEGADIIIDRDGTGIDTSYEVHGRRKESALTDDDEELEEWLDKAKDLSWIEVSEDPDEDDELSEGHAVHVVPYDRIVEEFGLDSFDEGDYAEEEEEEEKSSNRRPKRKTKRKPIADEEESDEVEDEAEDEGEATKEVKRRTARRSRRR